MNFTDEEFLDFTEALSDIFASNYLDNTQLWSWRNYGDRMQALRHAFESDDHSPRHSMRDGDIAFAVNAYRKDGRTCYELTFGNPGFTSRFDSLETLIGAVTDISRSLKLSARYSGEVV